MRDPFARTNLLAAGRREFFTKGILEARVEDIAHASGLSKGAFYLHFKSKEALFAELLSSCTDALEAWREKVAIPRARKPSVRDRPRLHDLAFLGLDEQLTELLWTWRDVLSTLLNGSYGTQFQGVAWVLLDEMVSWVRKQYADLQKRRTVRTDVSADAISLLLVGTYFMVARRLLDSKSSPEVLATMRDIGEVLKSSLAVPRRPRKPRRSS